MKIPNKQEKEAILTVLYDLDRYQGEEIIKDQHPLHLSVQALEKLCRPKGSDAVTQTQAKLFVTACKFWFRMLWSSRPNQISITLDQKPAQTKERRPDLAKHWASELKAELQLWLAEGMPER